MQCDVTDLQGNHCPEEAVHTVVFKGVETNLCERCHANVLAGVYGSHLTPRAADCCPRCGSNDWRYAIVPDTLEICNACGNSR